MNMRWILAPASILPLVFSSCSTSGPSLAGSHPSGTGPFDSRGNYVEAWADSPSQWRQASNTQIVEAQPDRPPADVPVSARTVVVSHVPEAPPVVAAPTPAVVASTPVFASTSTPVVFKKPTTPAPKPQTAVAKSTPKPKATTTAASQKPKPKTVAKVAAKPKTAVKTVAKPKTARHTVRSGDNLHAIAKRYGTSVGAIQKANSIKGSLIRPGQALTIPRS